MRNNNLHYILFVILLYLLSSCRTGHYNVDTSGIDVNTEIKRLEIDLFESDPVELPARLPLLKEKYGEFFQLFSYVINTGDVNETGFSDFLVRFCTDRQNNEVYYETMRVYPDLKEIEKKLSSAFRYYKYYFPERVVPAVYTCISGFNNSIITGDSILGIGLDRYLGADCEYYPRLGIYKYLSDRMTPSNVVTDCIYGWGSSEWDISAIGYTSDNVLTEMIHYGKLKYFERCMLPDEPEENIFGFTSGQMEFCRNNEDQMWQYLLEHDILFSTDQFIIRKLTGEAPFTSYFTNESPGMAAVWVGFRIVESYMMRNSGVKLDGLMRDTDIQGILEKARYSPK